MRELSVVELDLVVGGIYYMEDRLDEDGGGGSYSYGSSSLLSNSFAFGGLNASIILQRA
ncbi:hypothetical protein [Allosphingosinicella deserti]|uniref:hypothetical protein n=1 Tax=Allosphingosinicella deserti TaxID=2116704 RepID=UPI001304885C|nr:hypothetical protein [Sphingomonas deserti]